MVGASFYACHRLGVGDKSFNSFGIGAGKLVVSALFASRITCVAAVKVILSAITLHHLSGFGDGDTFGQCFMCLEFHKCDYQGAESIGILGFYVNESLGSSDDRNNFSHLISDGLLDA